MAILYMPSLMPAGVYGAGYKLRFYETATTDLVDTYTTADLDTEHPNPVVADSSGVFEPIWLDEAVSYRVQLLNSAGAVLRDDDPVNGEAPLYGPITAADADPDLVSDLLGGDPLLKSGGTLTGDLILDLDPATLNSLSAGFRGAPSGTHDATYTLVLADAGTSLLHTSGSAHTWTIPPNASVAFPVGTVISVVNTGAGAVTLSRGAGVSLRIAGNATDGNKTLAQHGLATLYKAATNDWYVAGAGVS